MEKTTNSIPGVIIARDVLTVFVSIVTSEAAFSASGRVVNKKRCNLSPEAIETIVCLKDWNLANKRLYDYVRETALVTNTENLKLSRHEWIYDSSPSKNSD